MSIRFIILLYTTSFWVVKCALEEETHCCINVERAEDLTDMDPDTSLSDPYVFIYGRDSAKSCDEYDHFYFGQTRAISNDLSPTWNEEFCAERIKHDQFYFTIYNENVAHADEFLGHTDPDEIDITTLACNKSTEFELPVNIGGTLFVSVECDYTCGPEEWKAMHVTSVVDESEMMIETKATFTEPETGVSGFVELDENGNIFIDLDVTSLDTSACSFVNGEVSLKYGIFDTWRYGFDYVTARTGASECGADFVGELFDPFNRPLCSELSMSEVSYYSCKLGDLSGRFGVVAPDQDKKIIISGNVSEDEDSSDASGFCYARLTPEALHQRAMVFMCNDENETPLFCAPFEIELEQLSL
mmetsp:Transcript_52570/g.87054  ORF Transcript_52570/g.87054 Transcript_52570/m.87054 type:complete len:358 (-) Transcript_52570:176-1249(-)